MLDKKRKIIGEVKNVKKLSYTSQMRDFVAYAHTNNFTFTLIVRKGTTFSKPMQRAIQEHGIIVQRTLP